MQLEDCIIQGRKALFDISKYFQEKLQLNFILKSIKLQNGNDLDRRENVTAIEWFQVSSVNTDDVSIDRLALTIDHKKMLTYGKGRGKTSGLIDVDAQAEMSIPFRMDCLDLMLSGNLQFWLLKWQSNPL